MLWRTLYLREEAMEVECLLNNIIARKVCGGLADVEWYTYPAKMLNSPTRP